MLCTLFTVTLPLILHPIEFLHCMALSSTWKYGSSSTISRSWPFEICFQLSTAFYNGILPSYISYLWLDRFSFFLMGPWEILVATEKSSGIPTGGLFCKINAGSMAWPGHCRLSSALGNCCNTWVWWRFTTLKNWGFMKVCIAIFNAKLSHHFDIVHFEGRRYSKYPEFHYQTHDIDAHWGVSEYILELAASSLLAKVGCSSLDSERFERSIESIAWTYQNLIRSNINYVVKACNHKQWKLLTRLGWFLKIQRHNHGS